MAVNAEAVYPVTWKDGRVASWLVTVDGGNHLGTFTTDPDLTRIDAMIAEFVTMVVRHSADGDARLAQTAGARIHLQSR